MKSRRPQKEGLFDQQSAQAEREQPLAARMRPRTLDEFQAVARDPSWSSRAVVYRRFLQSPDRPLSPEVGAEIVKLHQPGEMTGMLSSEDGYFVARYVSERAPANITFAMARDKLRAGYLERWQRQQFEELTGKLIREHKVEGFFDRIPLNERRP